MDLIKKIHTTTSQIATVVAQRFNGHD